MMSNEMVEENGRTIPGALKIVIKAETLRPTLYNKYKDDTNLSFISLRIRKIIELMKKFFN